MTILTLASHEVDDEELERLITEREWELLHEEGMHEVQGD
jgi:hypothetical protein